jgi:hypothetical protein
MRCRRLPLQGPLSPIADRDKFTAGLGGGHPRGEELMPRQCQRVRLENGIRLDINRVARRGFVEPGAFTGPRGIRWTNCDGEQIAAATITADMSGLRNGWFEIQSWTTGSFSQRIVLEARPRHFGGRQWFFLCP